MRRGFYRINSTVLSCRLNALNCISSRRSAGKLFHTRGPATENTCKIIFLFGERLHILLKHLRGRHFLGHTVFSHSKDLIGTVNAKHYLRMLSTIRIFSLRQTE